MKFYNQKKSKREKWEDVRNVVIYFAGERFVIIYGDDEVKGNPVLAPTVALVHSYLGNYELTNTDN